MPTARGCSFGWWAAAVLGVGAAVVAGCSRTPDPVPPPPAAPTRPPADIAEQVHGFCGGSCHNYPPADTFPKKHWRSEVERAFRFFEKSGLPLKPPPIEGVIRYYEDRAPDELPPADIPHADRPLSLKFEKISYPNPPGAGTPAISNLKIVRLPAPGKPASDRDPPAVLATDMQNGRVLLLRPADPDPAWKVIARVPHLIEVKDTEESK